MKKLLIATLLTSATAPFLLLFTEPAKADTRTSTYCYPVTQSEVIQNAADHPNAYANGYSEGRQRARKGDAYEPRTVGGEFARGFYDGYYGRSFSGQQYAVPNQVRQYTSQQCETYTHHRDYDHDRYDYDWDSRRNRRGRRYYSPIPIPVRPVAPRPIPPIPPVIWR